MVYDAVSERVVLSAQIMWWQWKINDVLFTEHAQQHGGTKTTRKLHETRYSKNRGKRTGITEHPAILLYEK